MKISPTRLPATCATPPSTSAVAATTCASARAGSTPCAPSATRRRTSTTPRRRSARSTRSRKPKTQGKRARRRRARSVNRLARRELCGGAPCGRRAGAATRRRGRRSNAPLTIRSACAASANPSACDGSIPETIKSVVPAPTCVAAPAGPIGIAADAAPAQRNMTASMIEVPTPRVCRRRNSAIALTTQEAKTSPRA